MRTASSKRPGSASPVTAAAPVAAARVSERGRSVGRKRRCQPSALNANVERKNAPAAALRPDVRMVERPADRRELAPDERDDPECGEAEAGVEDAAPAAGAPDAQEDPHEGEPRSQGPAQDLAQAPDDAGRRGRVESPPASARAPAAARPAPPRRSSRPDRGRGPRRRAGEAAPAPGPAEGGLDAAPRVRCKLARRPAEEEERRHRVEQEDAPAADHVRERERGDDQGSGGRGQHREQDQHRDPHRIDVAAPGGGQTKSDRAGDEHVLEELAVPAAGAAVHVPAVGRLELEPGALQDLRVEPATVVDDDQNGGAGSECRARGEEYGCDPLRVRRRSRRARRRARRRRARARGGRRARAARTRSGAARGSRSGPGTAAR